MHEDWSNMHRRHSNFRRIPNVVRRKRTPTGDTASLDGPHYPQVVLEYLTSLGRMLPALCFVVWPSNKGTITTWRNMSQWSSFLRLGCQVVDMTWPCYLRKLTCIVMFDAEPSFNPVFNGGIQRAPMRKREVEPFIITDCK